MRTRARLGLAGGGAAALLAGMVSVAAPATAASPVCSEMFGPPGTSATVCVQQTDDGYLASVTVAGGTTKVGVSLRECDSAGENCSLVASNSATISVWGTVATDVHPAESGRTYVGCAKVVLPWSGQADSACTPAA